MFGTPGDTAAAKQAVRNRIWRLLEHERVVRFPGARGRIANFVGAEAAAELLAGEREWNGARVVKANPDSPQLPVRRNAVAAGKVVYMAVPRLRDEKPFVRLEFALPVERGLVNDRTVIATTVHPLQLLDEELPETEHDFRVDLVVTPDAVVRPPASRRPPGIVWHDLDDEKVAAIPVLARLCAARG